MPEGLRIRAASANRSELWTNPGEGGTPERTVSKEESEWLAGWGRQGREDGNVNRTERF